MEDPIVTPEAPPAPPVDDGTASPQGDGQASPQPKPEDLVAKATRFVKEPTPGEPSTETIDEEFWGDSKLKETLDNIEDEQLRGQLQGLRKSLVSGANKKHMELAEKIKQIETANAQPQGDEWTVERVNALMQNPEFVKVAQDVAGIEGGEEAEEEYLSAATKSKLAKLDKLEQKMDTMENGQAQALRQNEHQRLQERYGNYVPSKIDEITQSVLEGKAHIGMEDIYKAVSHDDNVNKAYQMGLKDGANGLDDASQLPTLTPSTSYQPQSAVEPEKNESSKDFFMRIGLKNLLQSKKRA